MANLANFAYDPINYDYFLQLNVVDLFLGESSILYDCNCPKVNGMSDCICTKLT